MSSSLGCWRVGCLVVVTWLSLVALTIGQGPHPTLVAQAGFNTTTAVKYNDTNTVAIQPGADPISLNFYVDLDTTLTLSSPVTKLKVRITVPYETTNTSSGCKTYFSGYACKSTTYIDEPLVDFASFLQNLVLQPSPAVKFEKIENTTSTNYIEFDFDAVRINESVPDNMKNILFDFSTNLLSSAETSGRTSFNFQGEVMQMAGPGQQVFTNSTMATFTLVRPVVTSYSKSASPAVLSAGVTSTISITIAHDVHSTAAATSFQIAMSMTSPSIATFNNDTTWSKNGGGAISVGSLSNVLGGASSTVYMGDVITITFTMTAPAIPKLEATAGASITITYTGQNDTGLPTTFSEETFVGVNTPSVTLASSATDSNLGSTLPAGSTVTIQRTLELPVGILKGLGFGAYFETDDPNVNLATTLSFTSSTLPTYDQLTFSQPANINVGPSGISIVTSKRRKRATTTSLAATRTVGDITNSGPSTASLTLQVLLTVHPVSVGGSLTTADTYLTLNGNNVYLTSYSPSSIARPLLSLSKTAQVYDASTTPDIMTFSLLASHDINSNADAYDVKLYGGNNYFDVYWTSNYVGPAASSLAITNEREFRWDKTSLSTGNTMVMTYNADAATNGGLLGTGLVWINATLEYKSASGSTTTYYSTGGCCLTATDIGSTSLVADHGFTIMALLFGILLGFIIILVVMFILVKVCHKAPFNCECSCCPAGPCRTCGDTEIESQTHALAMGGGLVTNTKVAVNAGFYRAKDVVKSLQVSIGESIVGILRSSDKFKVHRELDNRDIESTIYVDTQIEEERDGAMAEATINLLKGLQANGDIPSDVMNNCLKKFRKGITDLDKDNENNFRNELGAIYDGLSKKNKEKLADLLARQQDEEEDTQEQTKNMSPKERDEVLKLMRKKHDTEKNELTYILKLEQDEESEKLRKEFTVRKRMGLKDLQQDTLDQIKKDAKLTDQQADWLMKEYLKNQAAVEKLYDDEISRQRMVLEEKLARRRALAAQAEAQEEHQTEMLNTLATQQMQTINKMKKDKVLSPEEAQALIDEAHEEMMAAKKKMDMERSHQEDDLQQKLSDRKRKRLENMNKKHEQEKTEMEKKHKSMQTDGYVDPLTLLEEQQNLVSIQRQEIASVGNEIDEEHAKELLNLRDESATATKKELEKSKDNLFTKLKHDGMSEDQADKIISKHKKDMAKLEQNQQEDRERQGEDFKKTLAKRKKEWESRREDEKKEQEQLREHEDHVVRKLMDNQVAISEDERERIMKEHEKQMVKLENSLTLNKLQQKRMLEERLAKKRSQQMEKLQKKQQQESKKVSKQLDNDSDMDDDERHQQELDIMKKHAEQRIAVLQGEKIELDDEMDAVRDEMLKERASSLKEQEVQLGAMLAALQMEKAKEMSRIEEQQKAIHDLKANLMDDLNEKGILSDPKCQQVIEMHRKEQEKLQNTLNAQRAKQEKKFQSTLQKRLAEKEDLLHQQQEIELNDIDYEDDQALRKRLQDRLKQKEANLSAMQDQQIKDAGGDGISVAARIRRAALKAKHLTEMEEFRNRMEKEINQTLEDVRRQNDMRRIQDLQEQELQFINGLVRLGSFKMEELEDVLVMLFPLKTDGQRKEMLATLTEGFKPRQDKDDYDENDGPGQDGTLIERVKSARFERARSASQRSARGARNNKPVNKKKGRKNENRSRRFEKRPEPLGRSNSPDYYSDEDYSVTTRSKSLSAKEKLKRRGR